LTFYIYVSIHLYIDTYIDIYRERDVCFSAAAPARDVVVKREEFLVSDSLRIEHTELTPGRKKTAAAQSIEGRQTYMLNTRNEETNMVFYSYVACFV